LNLSWARPLYDSSLTVGATLKTIYSSLEDYSSVGMAVDLGANYYFTNQLIDISLVVKNAGRQIKYYTDGNNEPLPFDIQFGVSKRLAKAPFRFSLITHHLQKFDMTYKDPAKDVVDPITGEQNVDKITFFEKLSRHCIIGAELLLSKNFHIRGSYNFQRRQELGIEEKMSTVGISYGFGFRISKFHLSYGRPPYLGAGAPNHFHLPPNRGDFFTKKPASSTL
ncbi:MAG TPA: PorV/PorQ family protein, partial [Bacteroidia bacterium]|nr:PorV/PorQ family protein [Bacteroidia bacterium]